jgi:maltose alpha-D-glucosyltransferase / alpha-amylase
MWHHDAVIYQIDPSLFVDSDGDGIGDLRGIEQQLEYVRSLGVSTVWLMPIYRSPFRDGGYDITDHLAIDPRFGNIADFVSLMERAESLGLRVLVELVMQHTSDQHPWFQAARRDRASPYRDYYIWADEPPADSPDPIFPGVEDSVWTWDEEAGQYYRHMFYSHEPDLDIANPRVRREIERVMAYWLRLGVHGFRIDAVSLMVSRACVADPRDDGLWLLKDLHDFAWQRTPGAILMGEADVAAHRYEDFFGDRDRLTHLLDFATNKHTFLAAARNDTATLLDVLQLETNRSVRGQHAVWLRNHDELDLDHLRPSERAEVMDAFAPDPDMRIYGRGIRRRLAPMLDGDTRRIAMMHALLLSLPGVPVLRYGDEIGMGENLALPERTSVRTPMQWHDGRNGGFSTADREALVAPPIADGPFGYLRVNVECQRWDVDSLLGRVRALVHARLSLPEMGGGWRPVKVEAPAVLGLRYEDPEHGLVLLVLANLGAEDLTLAVREDDLDAFVDVLCDAPYPGAPLRALPLRGYGYRWLRCKAG